MSEHLTGLHTAKEAAAQLRMHPITLRKRCAERLYPHLRVGRRIMFTDAHLEEIKRSSERPAIQSA